MGKSTAFLAVEAINSGKDQRVVAIDMWGDHLVVTSGETHDGEETFQRFRENVEPVADRIEIVRKSSLAAAASFQDVSCDFVFIDASHDYEDVCEDLRAWYPKVKPGGILAGHDYHWPEVHRAVKEFAREMQLGRPESRELCWIIRIGEDRRTVAQKLVDLACSPWDRFKYLIALIRFKFLTARRGRVQKGS